MRAPNQQGWTAAAGHYHAVGSSLSCCCDKKSAWIRARARAEMLGVEEGQDIEIGMSSDLLLQQPLLQIQSS